MPMAAAELAGEEPVVTVSGPPEAVVRGVVTLVVLVVLSMVPLIVVPLVMIVSPMMAAVKPWTR